MTAIGVDALTSESIYVQDLTLNYTCCNIVRALAAAGLRPGEPDLGIGTRSDMMDAPSLLCEVCFRGHLCTF